MKKIIIMLLCSIISINVCGQTKKTIRNGNRSALTQKKAAEKKKAEEEEAKRAAEAAAALQAAKEAKEAEVKARSHRNSLCEFGFDSRGLYSKQDASNDFVVYEIPEMSASELKAATLSAISSLFKSPMDVVTNLGDNIIQLERYASDIYTTQVETSIYGNDMSYSLIIQFKDGKVRYNIPSVKQIWMTGVPMLGSLKLDMTKPLSTLVDKNSQRYSVEKEFNNIIKVINEKIKKANDW